MEIDVSDYINGSTNEMEKDGSPLRSVPPRASGEGLPYAPADWPNPGDVWTWKVGNKANSSGYYTHRFLIVPKRLQKSPSRKIWLGSKTSVIHYLQSEFPEADVDAFFASFTWEIPTEIRPIRKDRKRPSRVATPLYEAESGSQISKRTRNSAKKCIAFTAEDTTSLMDMHLLEGATPLNEAESGSQISRRTRSSAKKCISFTANDATSLMDTHFPEGVSVDNLISNSASNKKNKKSEPDVSISPVNNSASQSALDLKPQDSKSLADYLAEMTAEDFEFYLNSLDDILSDSVSRAPSSVSAEMQMDDFTKARKELSSLLAMGFPSLVNSNKLSEVTNLSSKLQFDPYLSQEELSMLNLIREIPLASKDFLDANRVTEEASKFFAELEAKKANINERKNEYILSKGKISLLQAEEASATSTIREIDEQIAVLQSRRAVLTAVVKTNEKRIADLVSKQKQVFDSVPKIVNDVQMAKSEKSQWESKQKEAAKQEKKILSKFAPLVGFSFVR